MKPTLCIVIPVLDEAATIVDALQSLQGLRQRGACVIVVDGGSADDTPALARPLADQVLAAPRGRASQMNAGAAACKAGTLLFLHADTRLPADADGLIERALQGGRGWGRFDVRIDSRRPLLGLVATLMNARSRWTGVVTGDQALFVRADLFAQIGGFPDLPLMEDLAISERLAERGRPACLRQRVTTSARRWERHGVWRTIILMWRLRAAYRLGADPHELAIRYGYRPR